MAAITTPLSERAGSGLAAGIAAYVVWGFLPLLFGALHGVPSTVVVADRTICALVVVGLLLAATRGTAEVRAALADGAGLVRMGLAALLLAANWLIYIWGVDNGHLLELSFGYFINPLMSVALGIVLLGERLNRVQLATMLMALVAILIQAVGLGGVPYLALSIALTFAAYGYIRKTAKVGSAAGLFVETLLLSPLALIYLIYTFASQGSFGPHADPGLLVLLLLTGPATALPLLLFAFAVQRLRLTTIGMVQYISPSIAFVLAVTVFGEALNPVRLLSFVLIWISLAIYSADSYFRSRRARLVAA